MRVTHKSADGRLSVEVEGNDTKAIFDELAGAQEVFGVSTCGACDSKNVHFQVRQVQGNTYRAVRCADCGCELNFGTRKADGQIYPRRKDPKTQDWLPNSGWTKWTGARQSDDADDADDPFNRPSRR
jgi:predicted metal-binding protein